MRGDPSPFTGRGTGIIDTIHLVEVARAAEVLDKAPGWQASNRSALRGWFTDSSTGRYHEYQDCPARRQDRPRDVLGHAGGGVRAPHGR